MFLLTAETCLGVLAGQSACTSLPRTFFRKRTRLNTATLYYLSVSGCRRKPNILTFPGRLRALKLVALWRFAFSADLQHHSAQDDRLHLLFKNRDGKLMSRICPFEQQLVSGWSDIVRLWSGLKGTSVQHPTRTKLEWRDIYQRWPEGCFTAPVVPHRLKDDTVYGGCPKVAENKQLFYFPLPSVYMKGQQVVKAIAALKRTHKSCFSALALRWWVTAMNNSLLIKLEPLVRQR